MPFLDSPGWERHWQQYPWTWDFSVSSVREGHQVVVDKDKSEAANQGAKLTFGEVLDCGVLRMLDNLGTKNKRKFHDLGMGPGKMLIQTYLNYPNLEICMGVELAKGRYELAEKNVLHLIRYGWKNRKFLIIEYKHNEFLKIVEILSDQLPINGWQIGNEVIAFNPKLKENKLMNKNYHGKIINMCFDNNNNSNSNNNDSNKGEENKPNILYTIEYDDGEICENLQEKYIYLKDKIRILEIWYGSLFDYPNGFDADVCILETDFPKHMHDHLIKCMCEQSPIGCTFLTYHDLKKFECFNWKQLRQIDINIYDYDRYITSWSQGWRFFLWEHIDVQHCCLTSLTTSIEKLPIGSGIIYVSKKNENGEKNYGEILNIKKCYKRSNNHSLSSCVNEENIYYEIQLAISNNNIPNINKYNKYYDYETDHNNYDSSNIMNYNYQFDNIDKIMINSNQYYIYLSLHRHKLNDIIHCYDLELLSKYEDDRKYTLKRG